jgi:glycosyltransferase involved in cell wall biosynthesis
VVDSAGLPLVSVVVPCLNRAHFLRPTIESILGQDYPRIECLVVDGGSTDESLDILRSYGGRIRWISEPDHGHADAINKGWRLGSGEILAWLNADDLWEVPHAVAEAVAYLQANPDVDVVYGDCGMIDAEGRPAGMSYLREWDLAYAVEACDHCIPQPAAFMRRSIVERAGWLDVSFVSKKDHELWLRIGLLGSIRHHPVLLAHERACPGYMADRGDVTAAACVALTVKFFTLSEVPASLRLRRRRAISNAHLRGMRYAAVDGGHWGAVLRYLGRAVRGDPSNAPNGLRQLKACLAIDKPKPLPLRLASAGMKILALPYRIMRRIWPHRTARPSVLPS